MPLVVRSNFSDDAIALIQRMREWTDQQKIRVPVYVVYIDTGWAAEGWIKRVEKGQQFVNSCGFQSVYLTSKVSFSDLVIERNSFPSQKFQWCANFLKGLPLIEWLDEMDPACEATVVLPKRQSLYRVSIPEYIQECHFHGERTVWHPLYQLSDFDRDKLIAQAGFARLGHRSLECSPCIHSTKTEFENLSRFDKNKVRALESRIQKNLKVIGSSVKKTKMDGFSMGCGDYFGCGL